MSAWDQWGGKKPTSSGPSDALKSFVRTYSVFPMSSSRMDSKGSASISLTKAWDTARDFTKSAVATPTACDDAADVIEKGPRNKIRDETAGQGPLVWRRKATSPSRRTLTLRWKTRFKSFVAMMLLGMLFFGLAVLFLPLIMVRPSKFALSFTLGSMCAMGAFAMLRGPTVYISGLLQPNRLLLTSMYFVTLGGTVYSCLILQDYVFVVVSSVMQLMTLGSFALFAFPGGNVSLKAFGALFWKSARGMIQVIGRLFR
ncbi:unnamed protein product [Peronospora destructor]|uniref:Vesicle transport protein n=1 Tax=Peronospora destructor TaxID=86335 RepID=A0AAV0V809_9STRA|nr:unnamed protein product [Peronospora destructor]